MDLGRVYPILSQRTILSIKMINRGDPPKRLYLSAY